MPADQSSAPPAIEGAYGRRPAGRTPRPNPSPCTAPLSAPVPAAGVSHAAMEASSARAGAAPVWTGSVWPRPRFTNFTQDHLDYHATFDAYFAAKAGLFARVLPEDRRGRRSILMMPRRHGYRFHGLCARTRHCLIMRVGRLGRRRSARLDRVSGLIPRARTSAFDFDGRAHIEQIRLAADRRVSGRKRVGWPRRW